MPGSPPRCPRAPPRCPWDPSQMFLDPQMCPSSPQMCSEPAPDAPGSPQILGRGWDLGFPRCHRGLGWAGDPQAVSPGGHIPVPGGGGGDPSPFSQQEPSGRNSLQDASPRRDERVAGRREGTLPGVTTRHRSHIKGERRRRHPPAPPGGALRAPLWGRFAFTADSRTWGCGDSGRLGPSCPQIPGTPESPESPNPRHPGHSRGDESQHGGRGVPGDGLDGRDAATAVGVPAVGVDPHQCHPLRGPLGDGPRQGQRLGVRGTNPGCPRGSGAWEGVWDTPVLGGMMGG